MSSDSKTCSVFSAVWFKCISVLLIIALISGGLLAALNDILFVSAEERTMRAIKKIYGEEKEYSVIRDSDADDQPLPCAEFGTVNKVYLIGDENSENYDLLFNVTGAGGYKNGTVTLWVRVNYDEDEYQILKTVLGGFTKQTLMSKLGATFYDGFGGKIDEELFTAKADEVGRKNIVSGATYSANAAVNAVNCVIYYLGGEG